MTEGHDDVEELVATCLDEANRFTRGLVERTCAENPAVAPEIRKRYGALRAAGLVPDAGPNGLEPVPWSDGARRAADDPDGSKVYHAVGPYQPLREIGRGGQAVVYLAEDRRLHRPVALKILKALGPLTETMLRRFRREAEVASRLDHPGICAVFDAGVAAGVPYIAMRYIEGETLADRIDAAKQRRGVLEDSPSFGSTTKAGINKVLEVVEKTARALHVAHEAGIVHRDVKPGNIMITPRGEPVLLDFGLAGDEDGDFTVLTGVGDSLGTPAYMSPEQLMARRIRLDRRTDVYSLGVTLFECLTLERPFKAGTREALYEAIRSESPTDIRKLNPGLPKDVKLLVETALESDRDRRYQSAEALADDIARVRQGEPIAARHVPTVERAWRWACRRPMRATLVAALVLGIPVLTALVAHVAGSQPAILEARRQALFDRIEDHLVQGFDQLERGDPRAALASFDAVLALKPASVEALSGKALGLARLDDYEGCLRFIDRDGADVKEDWVLRYSKVIALEAAGREGEAADLEKTATRPVKGSLEHFLVGLTHLDRGRRLGQRSGPEFREAHTRFMTAALTAPEARMIYHLRLSHAAGLLDDADAAEFAAKTTVVLWPDSTLVNVRAAESLVESAPATAIATSRKARAFGSGWTGSPAPNDEWLAIQEERALGAMRKLLDRADAERHADSWRRVLAALENLASGWKEDLALGRREAVIGKRLEVLAAAPYAHVRAPKECDGLPDDEHDRWLSVWAAIDALAQRVKAADSK